MIDVFSVAVQRNESERAMPAAYDTRIRKMCSAWLRVCFIVCASAVQYKVQQIKHIELLYDTHTRCVYYTDILCCAVCMSPFICVVFMYRTREKERVRCET